jgi:hypothetical protein
MPEREDFKMKNFVGIFLLMVLLAPQSRADWGRGGDHRRHDHDRGESCDAAVAAFRAQLDSCSTSNPAGYCAEKYWPSFKSNYPGCIAYGVPVCIEYCQWSDNGGVCAEKCQ